MLKYLVVLGFIAVASAQHLAPHRYLPTPPKAAVVRIGNVDNGATGSVYFTETSEGIHITGTINGLSQGLHGFHVHAIGDITGGCLSTGAHFNPHNLTHGAPNVTERHVGDLGNIEANVNGTAVIDFYDSIIALSGEHNILGRGVVVHQDEDDLGLGGAEDSKTTGHAGARVGCGVIGTLNETNASTIVLPSTLAVVLALVLRML